MPEQQSRQQDAVCPNCQHPIGTCVFKGDGDGVIGFEHGAIFPYLCENCGELGTIKMQFLVSVPVEAEMDYYRSGPVWGRIQEMQALIRKVISMKGRIRGASKAALN